jgi:hypothetical protein
VLTFNIDNTQAGAIAQTGLAFTDLLPSSLQNWPMARWVGPVVAIR